MRGNDGRAHAPVDQERADKAESGQGGGGAGASTGAKEDGVDAELVCGGGGEADEHLSSSGRTLGNLIISIVGAGVLGLPYAFMRSGWLVSLVSLVTTTALTHRGMHLLLFTRLRISSPPPLPVSPPGVLGLPYAFMRSGWLVSLVSLAATAALTHRGMHLLLAARALQEDWETEQQQARLLPQQQKLPEQQKQMQTQEAEIGGDGRKEGVEQQRGGGGETDSLLVRASTDPSTPPAVPSAPAAAKPADETGQATTTTTSSAITSRAGGKVRSYGDLGERVYGAVGRGAVDAMVLVSQGGFCAVFLVFMGHNVASVLWGSTLDSSLVIAVIGELGGCVTGGYHLEVGLVGMCGFCAVFLVFMGHNVASVLWGSTLDSSLVIAVIGELSMCALGLYAGVFTRHCSHCVLWCSTLRSSLVIVTIHGLPLLGYQLCHRYLCTHVLTTYTIPPPPIPTPPIPTPPIPPIPILPPASFQIMLSWLPSLTQLAPFSIFASCVNLCASSLIIYLGLHSFQGLDSLSAFTTLPVSPLPPSPPAPIPTRPIPTPLHPFPPPSIFANCVNLCAFSLVIYHGLHSFQGLDSLSAFTTLQDAPFAFGVATYALNGAGMTLSVESSMRNRAQFPTVLATGLSIISVLYAAVGTAGYFGFGNKTKEIVTLNLPPRWQSVAVKLGVCVALFFTFPVMMTPVHEMAERYISSSRDIYNSFLSPSVAPSRRRLFVCFVRSLTVLFIVLLSVSVPHIGAFISLIGCSVCSALGFVVPALFHMKAARGKLETSAVVVDWFLVGFGVVFGVWGTWNALQQMLV
ncbi:unnamed protein product [Closterium sp. Naga37s-1]|nr:unnamed protein product [Closterium sp. Naga37s-1]